MKQRWLGVIEVLASGVFFGFLGLFGKKAYEVGILPGELLGLRFLISGLCLGAVLLVAYPRGLLIGAPSFVRAVVLGVFGYAVFASCFFIALQGLSASLTVLLLYTYPVMVTLGARWFFGEKIGRLGAVALLMASLGLVGLVWGEWEVSSALSLGIGFMAAVFYAAYILFSRAWLKDQNPFVSTFYIQLGAAAVLCAIHFHGLTRPWAIVSQNLALVMGVAVICSLLAMSLFLAGLRRLSGAETSILSTSEPVTGILLAAIFLGERLRPVQMLGGALVLGGMVLIALSRLSSDRRVG